MPVKISNVVFFILSLLLVSCEMKYKAVTFSYSSEFGFNENEVEMKAKNDSAAYFSALLKFFLLKKVYTMIDEHEDAFKPAFFELYNNEGNLVLPPDFSNKDIMMISSVSQFDEEEIREQIKTNIYH